MNPRLRPDYSRWTLLTAAAVAALFLYLGGLAGSLPLLALVVALYVSQPPFPFIVGQAAVPLVASLSTPLPLVVLEAMLLLFLTTMSTTTSRRSVLIGVSLGSVTLTLIAVGLTFAGWSLNLTAGGLIVLVLGSGYLLHRYSRVVLDLTTEDSI